MAQRLDKFKSNGYGKGQHFPDRPKNWHEWNLEGCTCQFCERKRNEDVTIRVACSGGCGCGKFERKPFEVCNTCGLECKRHVTHHGSEFCRAEIEFQFGYGKRPAFKAEPGKMYVKIRLGAADRVTGGGSSSANFRRALLHIEGLWVEVETKYLFADQFNLVPTPHTEHGLRLMETEISGIIGDVRSKRKACGWCGNNESNEAFVCTKCGKVEFKPVHRVTRRRCGTCERRVDQNGNGHWNFCAFYGYPAASI
jgi:hypothetical protein